jgi:hypothetical protein
MLPEHARAPDSPQPSIFERHYRLRELADIWNCSYDFVCDLFRNHPRVICIQHRKRGRRRYSTWLVPQSVAIEVYQSHLNGGHHG